MGVMVILEEKLETLSRLEGLPGMPENSGLGNRGKGFANALLLLLLLLLLLSLLLFGFWVEAEFAREEAEDELALMGLVEVPFWCGSLIGSGDPRSNLSWS